MDRNRRRGRVGDKEERVRDGEKEKRVTEIEREIEWKSLFWYGLLSSPPDWTKRMVA